MLKLEFRDQAQASFWIVDETFSIGSSNKNQMVVLRDGIMPCHANVVATNDGISISPAVPEARISVNYAPITTHASVNIGDVISLSGIELKLVDPSVRQMSAAQVNISSGSGQHASAQENPEDDVPKKTSRVQPWKIKATTGAHKEKLIDVSDILSIGRDNSNDLVVNGGHISRRHAELFVKNEQLIVRDLDSSNGTFVNGDRIKERAVFLGDEISFDSVIFRVAVGKAPAMINESSMDKTQFRPALNFTEEFPALDIPEPSMQNSMQLDDSYSEIAAAHAPDIIADDEHSMPPILTDEPMVDADNTGSLFGSNINIYILILAVVFLLALVVVGLFLF